jgi:hypothetical protein
MDPSLLDQRNAASVEQPNQSRARAGLGEDQSQLGVCFHLDGDSRVEIHRRLSHRWNGIAPHPHRPLLDRRRNFQRY